MFNSTISNVNKGLLLLMALSTRFSLINGLSSVPVPGLDLRGIGGGSLVKVRLQRLCLNAYALACSS